MRVPQKDGVLRRLDEHVHARAEGGEGVRVMQKTLTLEDVPKIWVSESKVSLVEELVKKYHYLGDKPFRVGYAYVLEHNGAINGGLIWHSVSAPETVVGAFGLERTEQDGIFELGRLVVSPKLNKRGLTSFFLSHSIRLLRKKINVKALLTYADSTKHTGTVYQACNFKYYGLTDKKCDFYIDGKIQERGKTKSINGEWKPRPQKHRYLLVFDKSLKILWKQKRYPKTLCADDVSKSISSIPDESSGVIPTSAHHKLIQSNFGQRMM